MENNRLMNEEELESISGGNTGADTADQGSVGSLPDVPGIGLYTPGHVGVYVGNGMAVSARNEDED